MEMLRWWLRLVWWWTIGSDKTKHQIQNHLLSRRDHSELGALHLVRSNNNHKIKVIPTNTAEWLSFVVEGAGRVWGERSPDKQIFGRYTPPTKD